MFHDIGKFEGIKDIAHQDISARYAKDILDKSAALPQTLKTEYMNLSKIIIGYKNTINKKKMQKKFQQFSEEMVTIK